MQERQGEVSKGKVLRNHPGNLQCGKGKERQESRKGGEKYGDCNCGGRRSVIGVAGGRQCDFYVCEAVRLCGIILKQEKKDSLSGGNYGGNFRTFWDGNFKRCGGDSAFPYICRLVKKRRNDLRVGTAVYAEYLWLKGTQHDMTE